MTTGLSISDLTVGYRTAQGIAPAVDEVSLTVAGGRALGIVGESGSGKTTLAHALGRHLPAGGRVLGGRIIVDGVDVLGLSARALRRWRTRDLAFVPQEAGGALDPTLRIGSQLDEALALQGWPRATRRHGVHDLLAGVRLPDPERIARRYPHQLSGGQQQRVVIAAALAKRPRLLVLDEPTTGLDAPVEAEVLALIDRLRRELAATLLVISHDLALVGRICDEVAVLYAGRVIEHGSATDVLRMPAHPYPAALLAATPTLGVPRTVRRLAAIPGRPPAVGSHGGGCRFAPRCAFADQLCHDVEPRPVRTGDHLVRCHYAGRLEPVVPATPIPIPVPEPAAGPPAGPRLRVAGLTRAYGGFTAVDDVSFTIGPAEIFGLVGESGSGKTTLARTIAGLGPRSGTGTLELSGTPLSARLGRRRRDVLRQVQLVFQQPDATLNPAHRVRTVLARAIRTLRGTGTVEELARRTQLDTGLLTARSTGLSGGQQQRVAIARAFAGSPDLVVCDEPVSALDSGVQAGVLELLATRRDRTGTSYLLISHDLAVVGYLADRVGVLYRGRLVEVGRTAEVLAGPHHPYTDLLVAAATRTGPAETVSRAAGRGCVFAARCPHHIGAICDEEQPALRRIGADHDVGCHLPATRLPRRQEGEFT